MIPNDDPRCIANTKRGRSCRNPPMAGRQVCKTHSGGVARRGPLTDPNVRARLVLRLQSGCTITDACVSAGVHRSTLYRWLETGEADAEHDRATLQRDLYKQVTKARADARVAAVATLRQAMQPFTRITRRTRTTPDGSRQLVEETIETVEPDWRAALAFLERSDPENWGRRDRVDATVRRAETPTDLTHVSDEQLAQIERLLGGDTA